MVFENSLGLPTVFSQGISKLLMRQLPPAVKLNKDRFFSRIVKVRRLGPKFSLKIVWDRDGQLHR